MTVKIGINGFGRIGRLAFRRIFELQARGGQAGDIEVAAINDLTTPATLAYLLKYDSTHGTFRHDDGTPVDVKATEDSIIVDGKEYKVYAEKDANNIPWVKNDGVEFVLECTGFYTSAEKSQAHINAGAKKVLISAPAKDEITPTIVFGVLHLLGVCMMLYPVYKKLPTQALAAVGVVLVVTGYLISGTVVKAKFLFSFGFVYEGFTSSDFFPILPHLGWYMLGTVLGRTVYADKKTRLPGTFRESAIARFFCWCGRQSLFIYLLHQPVVYGLLELIAALK